MNLKEYIKNSPKFRKIASTFYTLIFSPLSLFNSSVKISGAFLRGTSSNVHGENNLITIKDKSRLRNCHFFVSGNNNSITINENCFLQNTTLWIEGDNCVISIGESSSLYGGQIAALDGTSITIGHHCLFSYGIAIRTSDSHKIFNSQNKQINLPQSVVIENHVWLGANVAVLKNVIISHDSVVGYGSIVTQSLSTPHSIYAGVPAKLLKTDIYWKG